jgi:hypothetical protein
MSALFLAPALRSVQILPQGNRSLHISFFTPARINRLCCCFIGRHFNGMNNPFKFFPDRMQ